MPPSVQNINLGNRNVLSERPIPARQKYPARRWVVERKQAWQNKFRRVLVRWERLQTHFEAMLHLVSVLNRR